MLGDGDHIVAELFGALRQAELLRPGDGQLPRLQHGLDFHQVGQGEGEFHGALYLHGEPIGSGRRFTRAANQCEDGSRPSSRHWIS